MNFTGLQKQHRNNNNNIQNLLTNQTKLFSTAARAAEKAENVTDEQQQVRNKAVAKWLLVCCGMVFLMVVLGGVTRLTRSGLSMVEWKPHGFLPPLTHEQWVEEFEKYKNFPEYKILNYDMGLEDFKHIYFFEYFHRLWGRMIGFAFAGPMIYFFAKGYVNKPLAKQLGLLFLLGAAQGGLGWYMVKSGLDERTIVDITRPSVSPYRLASHLFSAFIIYAAMFKTALNLLVPQKVVATTSVRQTGFLNKFYYGSLLCLALTSITVVSGAFVAGMDAGRVYNTFPLMEGQLFPVDYWDEEKPAWRNFFENKVAVQFNHRVLAIATLTAISSLWMLSRGRAAKLHLPASVRQPTNLLATMALIQVSLGIATLLMHVPVSLGASHQAGSLVLFTLAIYLHHAISMARRIK